MNKKLLRIGIAASPVLLALMTTPLHAVDDENAGPRREDDAWYDVSEWFDGNDYNPTDEAIGRWDDEQFGYFDSLSSTDSDNDRESVPAEEFYGEDYDDGYATWRDDDNDGTYESVSRYHDTDGDKLNDSYATYRDDDGDGVYDNYEFSELSSTPDNAVHSSKIAQSTQQGLSGKSYKVTGTVADTKLVNRLGEISLLVQIEGAEGNVDWVDFGSSGTTLQLFKGDKFTAFGPVAKRGDKNVLVATTLEQDGKQRKIERTGRRYSGTIESTRTAKVKGEEHLVVKIKTENGKKLTVDMGDPASAKDAEKGSEITVTGVPVKIGDRVILIADQSRN
ncbi:hypothetical protein [Stieleria sp.]|uniref:hypothetical protein n=1 Tax=Stieleria sp. TaxID=2795976 RepID=UPI0035651DC4